MSGTVERRCPRCGGFVVTDRTRVNPPKIYTCPQCGAGLWLIVACSLGYKLIVAQEGKA